MLNSYEAIYDHGQIKWLSDKPAVEEARVIVTLLPERAGPGLRPKHSPSPRIAGKGTIHGDIMVSVIPETDWDALK